MSDGLNEALRGTYFKNGTQNMKDLEKLPDPRMHQIISFIKSGVRIAACVAFPFSILGGAILLGLAEIIGIYEELV